MVQATAVKALPTTGLNTTPVGPRTPSPERFIQGAGNMMKHYIVILACLASLVGCNGRTGQKDAEPAPSPVDSQAKLDFLASVPEFHELELKMTESGLNEIISRNKLGVQVTPEGNRKSYRIWNQDGENVIVGFQNGKCTGIQRMRTDLSLIENKK